MRIPPIFRALCVVIGVLAVAAVSAAQTVTGTLQGTVTDTGGGVLPGAIVTIKNVDTAATREVTTNDAGFYTAPFLAIGTYTGHGSRHVGGWSLRRCGHGARRG